MLGLSLDAARGLINTRVRHIRRFETGNDPNVHGYRLHVHVIRANYTSAGSLESNLFNIDMPFSALILPSLQSVLVYKSSVNSLWCLSQKLHLDSSRLTNCRLMRCNRKAVDDQTTQLAWHISRESSRKLPAS